MLLSVQVFDNIQNDTQTIRRDSDTEITTDASYNIAY